MKKKRQLIIALILIISSISILTYYLYNHDIKKHQPKIKEITNQIPNNNIDYQLEKIKNLARENNDLIGWLTIDNTNINYPVMYTYLEDYYLDKDFYKNDYKAGSLYIDKHNNLNPRDTNLIIHGHSMKDGTMFHDLLKYEEKSFYDEHQTFTFYTLKEKENYEIIAVIISKVYKTSDDVFKYYQFYNATSEEEYSAYLSNIKKLAIYDTGKTANYGDILLTLSTCEYSGEDSRLAVIAKKIS